MAEELYGVVVPVVVLPADELASIDDGAELRIGPDGVRQNGLTSISQRITRNAADARDGQRHRVPGGQEPAKLAEVLRGGLGFFR